MKTPAAEEPNPLFLTWLGLAWVWSGALWLLAAYGAFQAGWAGGVLLLAGRMGAAVAVGVGLCARERWAWAAGVCTAALYLVTAGSLGLLATGTLATLPPGTLSWQPVFWGLSSEQAGRAAWAAGGVAGMSLLGFLVLWRSRSLCDIPIRRVFSTLSAFGPWPTLPVALADGFLLYTWWSAAQGGR